MKQNNYTYKGESIEKLSKEELIEAYREIIDCIKIDIQAGSLTTFFVDIPKLRKITNIANIDIDYTIELADPKELNK